MKTSPSRRSPLFCTGIIPKIIEHFPAGRCGTVSKGACIEGCWRRIRLGRRLRGVLQNLLTKCRRQIDPPRKLPRCQHRWFTLQRNAQRQRHGIHAGDPIRHDDRRDLKVTDFARNHPVAENPDIPLLSTEKLRLAQSVHLERRRSFHGNDLGVKGMANRHKQLHGAPGLGAAGRERCRRREARRCTMSGALEQGRGYKAGPSKKDCKAGSLDSFHQFCTMGLSHSKSKRSAVTIRTNSTPILLTNLQRDLSEQPDLEEEAEGALFFFPAESSFWGAQRSASTASGHP